MSKILKWIFMIFIFIFLIVLYARYVGTLGLETKEYTISDKNIPDGFDGLKIVHFSDLHYNRAINTKKISEIIDEINLINPDIVVFTGDLIDKDVILKDKDFDSLTKLLNKINTKYGKYAIAGNHDISNIDKVTNVYNNSNFKYLDNDYDIIYNKSKEKIFIGGLNSVSEKQDDIGKMMSYFKDNEDAIYKIILVHEPDIVDTIKEDYSVNLILAGHSHNGQVRLPIIGPIYTPPYAKKYYDNYYNLDGTNLYISSGIGVSTANYRLFNHPSINFYRINKQTIENNQ